MLLRAKGRAVVFKWGGLILLIPSHLKHLCWTLPIRKGWNGAWPPFPKGQDSSSHGKGLGHVLTFIPCLDKAGFMGKEMGLTPPGVGPLLPVPRWARLTDPR